MARIQRSRGSRWTVWLAVLLGMAGGLWAGLRGEPSDAGRSSPGQVGAAEVWRSSLPEMLQPLAASLAEAVDEIPVYLPAELPLADGRWSAFYEAGPDRFGITLVEVDQPVALDDPSLRQTPERWIAHLSGGRPGSLLLQPPGLEGRATAVDLGRGIVGYQRACKVPNEGAHCPLTVILWRSGGWTYYVWTADAGTAATQAVQEMARRLVSGLPGFLNPVRADSSGYMAVRLAGGREETGILWFHPEADLFVGHRDQAMAALHMAAQLEQVD